MKTARAIGNMVAILLFCIGIGVYCTHTTLKHVVNNQLIGSAINEVVSTAISSGTDLILNELPDEIKNQVPNPEELESALPKEVQAELEDIKDEIANDPQVLALTQKYMEAIIAGSADKNAVLPDVNKDIEEVIETNFPKIADAVGTKITQEQVSDLAKKVVNEVDAQTLFERGVDTIRTSITPQQQKMLSSVNFIQSANAKMLAFACMGVAICIIALLKKSFYKWTLPIGVTSLLVGILIIVGLTVGSMFIQKGLQSLGSIFSSVGEGVINSLFQSGMYFSMFGAIILVVYFATKLIIKTIQE